MVESMVDKTLQYHLITDNSGFFRELVMANNYWLIMLNG